MQRNNDVHKPRGVDISVLRNTTAVTVCLWPPRLRSSVPVSRSHTFTVVSWLKNKQLHHPQLYIYTTQYF